MGHYFLGSQFVTLSMDSAKGHHKCQDRSSRRVVTRGQATSAWHKRNGQECVNFSNTSICDDLL
jgi:hypothetical protein